METYKAMKLTRSDLIWLYQHCRTERSVCFDKENKKFVYMFNPWKKDKQEKIYIGKPNLDSIKFIEGLLTEIVLEENFEE